MTDPNVGLPVMGPGISATFSEKAPPAFDGLSDYTIYREDVVYWLQLTNLPVTKQGCAILAYLSGEAKSSAKSLGTEIIFASDGVQQILEKLDSLYKVDKTDQLDIDLTTFLDYKWCSNTSVEQFIAGFHTRLDKISSLQLDDKLKGHLLLRQAGLDSYTRNMVIGAASGKYDVTSISNSLRQAFRNQESQFSTPTLNTHQTYRNNRLLENNRRKRGRGRRRLASFRNRSKSIIDVQSNNIPTFFSFYTYRTTNSSIAAIVDSGASSSVVGKNTLDRALQELNITQIDENKPKQRIHKFGNYEDEQHAIMSVVFPFHCRTIQHDLKPNRENVRFNISFDVIEGDLPFLIGFPLLRGMKSVLNFRNMTLGVTVEDFCFRIPLHQAGNHVHLNFKSAQTYLAHLNQSHNYSRACNPDQNNNLSKNHSESGPNQTPRKFYSNQKNTAIAANSPAEDCVGESNFSAEDLKKLHIQLKHGSYAAMKEYLQCAYLWQNEYEKNIQSLIEECTCLVANYPKPHSVLSSTPPARTKQMHLAIDVIFFEGVPFLHVVCRCTGWSETAVLRDRQLYTQTSSFTSIQLHRHGIPKQVHCDREYNKGAFKELCDTHGIKLVRVAANDHEANGSIEAANRVLRHFFRRIRADDKKSPISSILSQATYGKTVNKGSKLASSFELLYVRKPIILNGVHDLSPIVTLDAHVRSKARKNIRSMLRHNKRHVPQIKKGDFVLFWRDKERWIGPGKVISIENGVANILHGGKIKTSGMSRVQKTAAPLNTVIEELEAEDDELSSENEDASGSIAEQETKTQDKRDTQINDADKQRNAQLPWISGNYSSNLQKTKECKKLKNELDINPNEDYTENTLSSFYSSFLLNSDSLKEITEEEKTEVYRKELLNYKTMGAFVEVSRKHLPGRPNVIGSHVIYHRKNDGSVKARICPWGHRDLEKAQLRKDAPCMAEEVLRLVLSFSAEMKWKIGEMDVTATFLQAKGFEREVYVRPPAQESSRNVIWKLTKAAHGLADSGRLWYITSDSSLVDTFGATRSQLEPTLYYKNNSENQLCFLLVVQVDNYISTGTSEAMLQFETFLKCEFSIGELEHSNFEVFGCEIKQDSTFTVTLSQKKKFSQLPTSIHREIEDKNRSGNDLATLNEISSFKSMIGKLLFIGRLTKPVLLRIASHMAAKTSKLLVHHLKDLEALIRQTRKDEPTVLFRTCSSKRNFIIDINTDASMPKNGDSKSREGFIAFRRCQDIVHPIHWTSKHIRRVARSTSTAETLSAADATDFALYLQALLKEISYPHDIVLTTDSRAVFNNVTSTRKPEEIRNLLDLAAMLECFEAGTLAAICWSPGYYMVSDALTKYNRTSIALLQRVLTEGHYQTHPESKIRVSPKEDVIDNTFVET